MSVNLTLGFSWSWFLLTALLLCLWLYFLVTSHVWYIVHCVDVLYRLLISYFLLKTAAFCFNWYLPQFYCFFTSFSLLWKAVKISAFCLNILLSVFWLFFFFLNACIIQGLARIWAEFTCRCWGSSSVSSCLVGYSHFLVMKSFWQLWAPIWLL